MTCRDDEVLDLSFLSSAVTASDYSDHSTSEVKEQHCGCMECVYDCRWRDDWRQHGLFLSEPLTKGEVFTPSQGFSLTVPAVEQMG